MARKGKREEDYLEAMYVLIRSKGNIRIKDLSEILNVKPPSVVDYLNRLADKGLVKYEKHSSITLTEEGLRIAKEVYKKHLALKEFLTLILGVPEEIAEEDACYIEHRIHDITLNRLIKLVEYFRKTPKAMEILKEWKSQLNMKTSS